MAGSNARLRRFRRCAAGASLLASALAAQAAAQTMNSNAAAFNAGFGRVAGEENRPINITTTDGGGNTTLVNGLIQPGAGSLFAEIAGAGGGAAAAAGGTATTMGGASGAGDSFTGAGGAAATAIGNSLNVIVQGDNNTVIVNATQNNSGAVTATVSGK
jgi:holdfast attachment protein HfaA